MRYAAMTVDVDRDVNMSCKGKCAAVSNPKDGSDSPRFSSSLRGLEVLVSTFNDHKVRGTFFMEAATAMNMAQHTDLKELMKGHEIACHAFDHEDLTGKDTGVVLTREEIGSVLDRSTDALNDIFGKKRWGFRAPYLHSDDMILDILREREFLYDSSNVEELKEGNIRPYVTSNGLPEVPISSSRDARGKKIVGYLWPYHERKRPIGDYLHMVKDFRGGLLVLATHSWHMVETFGAGDLPDVEVERTARELGGLLDDAVAEGLEFVTIEEYLTERTGGSC